MPLYEYYCSKCSTKFDALRPINQADAPIKCELMRQFLEVRIVSRKGAEAQRKRIGLKT